MMESYKLLNIFTTQKRDMNVNERRNLHSSNNIKKCVQTTHWVREEQEEASKQIESRNKLGV